MRQDHTHDFSGKVQQLITYVSAYIIPLGIRFLFQKDQVVKSASGLLEAYTDKFISSAWKQTHRENPDLSHLVEETTPIKCN